MKTYAEDKRIRPDILTGAVYWSIVIMMTFNIISVRIFGNMGAGFCAVPLELYFLFYIVFVLAAQKSVYIMVRLRARRSQFINAEANMTRSMHMFVAIGIILAIILVATSLSFAKNLLGSGKVYFQIIIVAISLVFLCPQGVIRGYLQGLGYTKPIVLSDLLIAITSFVSGGVISVLMYNYGKKVNELFHGDEYSAIYGASGMMIGLLIGSFVGFVQISISRAIRKKEIADVVKNGAPRYLDNKNDVYTGIRPIVYLYASPILMCLVDNIVYNVRELKNGNGTEMILNYGAFSGRVITFVILLSFLCCIPFIKAWNRVMARVERDELEGARDRLRRLLHFMYMLLIPVATGIFVSSEVLHLAVFGKSAQDIGTLFQFGGVMFFLLSLGIFLGWLLNHMGKSVLLAINLTASWVVHVAAIIVLVIILSWDIKGVIIAQIGAFAVYDFMCMFMLLRMLKLRANLLFNIGMPLISSALAGLVLYAENKILVDVIGEVLTLLVGIIIYVIVYMLLMIVLRGISTFDLDSVPGGKLFMWISARIQHDRYYED